MQSTLGNRDTLGQVLSFPWTGCWSSWPWMPLRWRLARCQLEEFWINARKSQRDAGKLLVRQTISIPSQKPTYCYLIITCGFHLQQHSPTSLHHLPLSNEDDQQKSQLAGLGRREYLLPTMIMPSKIPHLTPQSSQAGCTCRQLWPPPGHEVLPVHWHLTSVYVLDHGIWSMSLMMISPSLASLKPEFNMALNTRDL